MSSSEEYIQFIVDQIEHNGEISYRKMFWEYAIYWHNKVVALVCDNQLFIKPTSSGREFIWNVTEAPAYPWAKMSYLIEDRIEDREWLSELIRITAAELPEPKPKKPKIKI